MRGDSARSRHTLGRNALGGQKRVSQNLECGLVFPKLALTTLFQGYIRHPETRIVPQLFLMSGQEGPI